MRIIARVLVLGATLVACRPDPQPSSAPPPSPPPPAVADAGAPATSGAPTRAGADGADCVEECVARSQMQARPIEMIRADCQKVCSP